MKRDWIPIEEMASESGDWLSECPSYEELIESTGVRLVTRRDIGDYSGDSLAVVSDGDRWGFLSWGWGSCSGCDALLACRTLSDADELRERLYDAIVWRDSKAGLLSYLREKDWKTEWYGSVKGVSMFLERAERMLSR